MVDKPRSRPSPGHIAGTVLFLLIHAALLRATLFLVGLSPMSTRSSGLHLEWVALWGGIVLLLANLVLSVSRLVCGRSAFGIAVTGCLLQSGLGAVVLAMG